MKKLRYTDSMIALHSSIIYSNRSLKYRMRTGLNNLNLGIFIISWKRLDQTSLADPALYYCAVQPPSTLRLVPVTRRDASEAR